MAGVAPNFSLLDVVRALLTCSDVPMSRVELVERLGLGEGSVRSILDDLKKKGFLESSRTGHVLSRQGKILRKDIEARINGPMAVSCPVFAFPFQAGVRIQDPQMGVDFVMLRDIALKWGAEAALVLRMERGVLGAPQVKKTLDLGNVKNALDPRDGDVVVVTFANSLSSAETSAMAVALRADPLLRGLMSSKLGQGREGVLLP